MEKGSKTWFFATYNDKGITYKVVWLPDDNEMLYQYKLLFDKRFHKVAQYEWATEKGGHSFSIRFDLTSFSQNLIVFTRIY